MTRSNNSKYNSNSNPFTSNASNSTKPTTTTTNTSVIWRNHHKISSCNCQLPLQWSTTNSTTTTTTEQLINLVVEEYFEDFYTISPEKNHHQFPTPTRTNQYQLKCKEFDSMTAFMIGVIIIFVVAFLFVVSCVLYNFFFFEH